MKEKDWAYPNIYPYKTFGLSERAARAILLGLEPALRLSKELEKIPIDIVSDHDGHILATLRCK